MQTMSGGSQAHFKRQPYNMLCCETMNIIKLKMKLFKANYFILQWI